MAGRQLAFGSPSTPQSGCLQTDQMKVLLNAITGVSRMMTSTMESVVEKVERFGERLEGVHQRLDSLEEKVDALGNTQGCREEERTPKRRRIQNPKIAEAVRRLHSSENNQWRYNPEQGMLSPHNIDVTHRLKEAISNSPNFREVDSDAIKAACKTHYENVRRNFRYSMPEFSSKAEAARQSSKSRSRRTSQTSQKPC